jgi:hypothetical protein
VIGIIINFSAGKPAEAKELGRQISLNLLGFILIEVRDFLNPIREK